MGPRVPVTLSAVRGVALDLVRVLCAPPPAHVDVVCFGSTGAEPLAENARGGWPKEMAGLSRREVVRQLGLAAVIALPLVTSIVAPRATQAVSCGQPCTNDNDCTNPACRTY